MPRDGEIGPEKVRRKRASLHATPTGRPPASATTETRASARKAAIYCPEPSMTAPPSEPIGGSDASGENGATVTSLPMWVAPHLANIVSELAAHQRRRRFCIQQQSRADRSIESLIASTLGFRIDATEKERKTVFSRARAYRLAVEKGGEGHDGGDTQDARALSAMTPLILASAGNRAVWDGLRKDSETEMVQLAKQLPVHAWAQSVRGFGDKGLAIIVGEAGIPIGEYRTVEGLWKRMGLAVIDGERQRRKTDKVQAAAHGYSPKRRAEIWTLADSMFRAQWSGERLDCLYCEKPTKFKEGTGPIAGPICDECGKEGSRLRILEAHPVGPYGEVYAARRLNTDQRIETTADLPASDPQKWTPGRCNNDAKRVMSKALLKDLWVEWKRCA